MNIFYAETRCGEELRVHARWSRGLAALTAISMVLAPVGPVFAAEARARRAVADHHGRVAANLGLPLHAIEEPARYRAEQDAVRKSRREQAVSSMRARTRHDPARLAAKAERVAHHQKAVAARAHQDFGAAAAQLAAAARAALEPAAPAATAGRLESVRTLAQAFRRAQDAFLVEADRRASLGPPVESARHRSAALKVRQRATHLEAALRLRCTSRHDCRPLLQALAALDGAAAPGAPAPHVLRSARGFFRAAAQESGPLPHGFLEQHGARARPPGDEAAALRPAPPALPLYASATLSDLGGLLAAVPPPPAIAAPTAADLASTDEAPAAAPEVAALAQSLGKSPGRIFRYVHDSVETLVYRGSKKGARGALAEKAANDEDQASLLIALLRAAGVPARYLVGTVVFTADEAMEYTGTDSALAAASFLVTQGTAAKVVVTPQGTLVEAEHVWVRAHAPFTNYRGLPGAQSQPVWVELDPSVKRYQPVAPAANLRGKASLDFDAWVRSAARRSPVVAFEDALRQYLKTSGIYCPTMEAASPLRKIVPLRTALLPSSSPLFVKALHLEHASVPPARTHAVTLRLSAGPDTLLDARVSLAQAYGRRVMVEYEGATAADQQAIDAAASIYDVPPYSVSVVPAVKLDGQLLARGVMPTTMGRAAKLDVSYPIPGLGTEAWQHALPTGAPFAYHLDPGYAPAGGATALKTAVATKLSAAAKRDDVDQSVLAAAGALFFAGQDEVVRRLLLHQRHRPLSDLSAGLTRRQALVNSVYGQPVSMTAGGYVIDLPRLANQGFPNDGDPKDQVFLAKLAGYEGSLREATVWGETFSGLGASAVRTLQQAAAQGVALSTFDASTAGAVLPTLTLSSKTKTSMQSWLSLGATVTTHRSPVSYDGLGAQEGYVAVLPSGVGGYILAGALGGGYAVENLGGGGPSACGSPLGAGSIGTSGLPLVGTQAGNNGPTHAYGGSGPTGPGGGSGSPPPGSGGSCSFGAWVLDWLLVERANKDVDVYDPAGVKHGFSPDGTPTGYRRKPGVDGSWVLARTTAPDGWRLDVGKAEVVQFDTFGRPVSVVGLFTRARRWVYSSQDCCPLRVETPAGGLMYSFTCTAAAAVARVGVVTDTAGRTLTYTWDNDNLVKVTDASNATVEYGYDGAGNLITVKDRAGGIKRFDYGAEGRVVRVTYPDGSAETFSWNLPQSTVLVTKADGATELVRLTPSGKVAEVVDALGNSTSISYDAAQSTPTQVSTAASASTQLLTDDAGTVTGFQTELGSASITRDASGNPTAITGPAGTTQVSYHPTSGRVSRITGPSGAELASFTYNANGTVQSLTDTTGTQSFSWAADGELAGVSMSGGRSLSVTYQNGRVQSLSDGTVTRSLGYDGAGRITSISTGGPNPVVATIAYDGEGRVTQQKALDGTVTTTQYDAAGRPIAVTDPRGLVTTTRYDAAGRPVVQTAPGGLTWRLAYDALGRLTELKDPRGLAVDYGFCAALEQSCPTCGGSASESGAPCELVDAVGNTWQRVLDAKGRTVGTVTPAGSTASAFDAQGRLSQVTYAKGRVSRFTYSARSQLATVTEALPGGAQHTTTYTYGADDRLASIRDANGGQVAFTYASGQLTEERVKVPTSVDPSGWTTTRYTYNGAGRVASVARPSGRLTCFTRDSTGRPLTLVHTQSPDTCAAPGSGARAFTYAYDLMGRTARETGPAYERTYVRDAQGRLSEIRDHPPASTAVTSLKFEYLADGRMGKLTASAAGSSWSLDYQYGSTGAPNRLTLPDGKAINVAYDALARVAKVSYPSGQALELFYDANGRVQAQLMRGPAGQVVRGVAYRYDASGNVSERTDEAGNKETFAYDVLGRVVSAARLGVTTPYTYDGTGNLLSRGSTALAYDVAHRLLTSTTGGQATSYAYDADGNNTQVSYSGGGSLQLGWGPDGRLLSATPPGGAPVAYDYDVLGRRVLERAGATERRSTALAVTPLVVTRNGALDELFIHLPGLTGPAARWTSGGVQPFAADGLGSQLAVFDSSGGLLGRADYDALGATREATGAALPLGFAGGLPTAGGLTQALSRHYDGTTGRFNQPDPLSYASLFAGLKTPGRQLELHDARVASVVTQPHRFARYAHPPNPTSVPDLSGEGDCPVMAGGIQELLLEDGLINPATENIEDALRAAFLEPWLNSRCWCVMKVIAAVDPQTFALIGDTYFQGAVRGFDMGVKFAMSAVEAGMDAAKDKISKPWDEFFDGLGEDYGIDVNPSSPFMTLFDKLAGCPADLANPLAVAGVNVLGMVFNNIVNRWMEGMVTKISVLGKGWQTFVQIALGVTFATFAFAMSYVMWFKTCQMAFAFEAVVPGGYGGCYPAGGAACSTTPTPTTGRK